MSPHGVPSNVVHLPVHPDPLGVHILLAVETHPVIRTRVDNGFCRISIGDRPARRSERAALMAAEDRARIEWADQADGSQVATLTQTGRAVLSGWRRSLLGSSSGPEGGGDAA